MKVIVIGDTHGRTLWKEIVAKEKEADKIIFLGDYFDTHYDITPDQQIENFNEIIEFKLNNFAKVELLLGNHDFHYLNGVGESYSGYNSRSAKDINDVLQPVVDNGTIKICYVHDKYLLSHAGVTKTWCMANGIKTNDLVKNINIKLLTNKSVFKFSVGDNYSNSGDDITQTPIWVRIPSLIKDKLDDYIHVIGHTTVERIDGKFGIIPIDCIGTSGEYLVIENLVARPEKV